MFTCTDFSNFHVALPIHPERQMCILMVLVHVLRHYLHRADSVSSAKSLWECLGAKHNSLIVVKFLRHGTLRRQNGFYFLDI